MLQQNLIKILFLLVLPLLGGYLFKSKIKKSEVVSSKLIQLLTIYLIPFISLIIFWQIEIEINLITLPIIGVIITTLAGIIGFVFSHFHNLNKQQQGSYLAGAAFSNIGWSGGTLFSYIFLGQAGLALAMAYTIYFNIYYYTIGFSLASYYRDEGSKRPSFKKIFSNKLVYLPLLGIAFGILLNISDINFPLVLQKINDYFLLPIFIVGAVFAVGLTLYIRNVWQCKYSKGVYLSMLVIKFVFTPIIGLFLTYLFKLSTSMTMVVFIMSLMPAAESSMHISRIFGLDQNLANSNYLVTTFLTLFWSIPIILLVNYLWQI